MAYTTINKSGEHFNTKLFNGTGSNLLSSLILFCPFIIILMNKNSLADKMN